MKNKVRFFIFKNKSQQYDFFTAHTFFTKYDNSRIMGLW